MIPGNHKENTAKGVARENASRILVFFRGTTARVKKVRPKQPQVEGKRSIQRSVAIFVGREL